MAEATLSVEGMTCDGCVRSVTNALKAVPGVQTVEVSLEKHAAAVTYTAGKISVDDLKTAIEDAGYDVVS